MSSQRMTTVLHALVAAAVLHQLATSLFFDPRQYSFGITLRWTHDRVGLLAMVLLSLFWLWVLVRGDQPRLAGLFPWLSPRRLKRVAADCRDLVRGLPRLRRNAEQHHPDLAAAVQGMGLLLASILALSGAYIFFFGMPTLVPPIGIRRALTVHLAVADLMWIFIIGHGTMAVLQFAGGALQRPS
jgi:cytochrome b561